MECCARDQFKAYANYLCVFDPAAVRWLNVSMIVISMVSLGMLGCLLKASVRKKVDIMVKDSRDQQDNSTFSCFSLYILNLTQVNICVSSAFLATYLFQFAVGEKYQAIYIRLDPIACLWSYHTVPEYIQGGLVLVGSSLTWTITLLQLYEWMAMLYIISTQRNRDVNQILYEHNAEDMSKSTQLITFRNRKSQSNLQYRKREYWLRYLFIGIAFASNLE